MLILICIRISGSRPKDALLLAEKHFGEPAPLRTAMGETRPFNIAGEFWRRLAAITILTAIAQICASLVRQSILLYWRGTVSEYVTYQIAWLSDVVPTLIALTILLWYFWRTERRIRAGGSPWFFRFHPLTLTAMSAATLLLCGIASNIPTPRTLFIWPSDASLASAIRAIELSQVGIALLWIWWSSRTRNLAFAASFLGFLAWTVGQISITAVAVRIPQTATAYERVMNDLRARESTVIPASVLAFVLFWILRAMEAVYQWWTSCPVQPIFE